MTHEQQGSSRLDQILLDVEQRVDSILTQRSDWLCRKGCDGCCRRLAEPPQLTLPEWERIWHAFLELSEPLQRTIRARVETLRTQTHGPFSCPFLQHHEGACMIYAARPVACRTYGFYRSRDQGLYCKDIQREVDHRALDDVVWGNQDVVDLRLKGLGSTRSLPQWFRDGSMDSVTL
ncbi:MAG: YkgJ family cysteine cluster protein [Methylococcus sp.]|nr:MAG: YkgJ family cysteine cluster protein [Methylococcus sp.]